jgi:hypothetical protein
MFDLLFKCPATVRRNLEAPYAQERQNYLAAQVRQGNTYSTLLFTARDLLWVAQTQHLSRPAFGDYGTGERFGG